MNTHKQIILNVPHCVINTLHSSLGGKVWRLLSEVYRGTRCGLHPDSIYFPLLIHLQRHTSKLFFNRMIGQKTINSFFNPVSKKRISKDLNETEKDEKDSVSLSTQIKLIN